WCGPCRMIGPIISALAEKYEGTLKVGKVNVDDNGELAASFGVSSIPCLMIFKNGEVVNHRIGAAGQPLLEAFINESL
ncbi:MAG: thioredoxin, partial [Sphaerochaetaceae bacterium]|nr:thioredoxin [Sphaerochaetaceae bacterium]